MKSMNYALFKVAQVHRLHSLPAFLGAGTWQQNPYQRRAIGNRAYATRYCMLLAARLHYSYQVCWLFHSWCGRYSMDNAGHVSLVMTHD